jgi:hypothetical protein
MNGKWGNINLLKIMATAVNSGRKREIRDEACCVSVYIFSDGINAEFVTK